MEKKIFKKNSAEENSRWDFLKIFGRRVFLGKIFKSEGKMSAAWDAGKKMVEKYVPATVEDAGLFERSPRVGECVFSDVYPTVCAGYFVSAKFAASLSAIWRVLKMAADNFRPCIH